MCDVGSVLYRAFLFPDYDDHSILMILHRTHFSQVIEDDVNEALRLMKMSKVRRRMPAQLCFLSLALTLNPLMVSQVSLEDTMQDENPKLDPVTAVYMVGRTMLLFRADENETLKRTFSEQ